MSQKSVCVCVPKLMWSTTVSRDDVRPSRFQIVLDFYPSFDLNLFGFSVVLPAFIDVFNVIMIDVFRYTMEHTLQRFFSHVCCCCADLFNWFELLSTLNCLGTFFFGQFTIQEQTSRLMGVPLIESQSASLIVLVLNGLFIFAGGVLFLYLNSKSLST